MTHEAMTVVDSQTSAMTLDDPDAMIEVASKRAQSLKKIIDQCGLSVRIGKGEHVMVEAWGTLARFDGCAMTQIGKATKREDGAWEARAGLRRLSDGMIIAEAEHECGGPDDAGWHERKNKDTGEMEPVSDYAKKSMAITRAMGKVCRMNYSWIIVLAGYSATPLEEMPKDHITPQNTIPHSAEAKTEEIQDYSGEEWEVKNWYPYGIPVYPIGKHKGKSVTELPEQYMEWGLENLDNDSAKAMLTKELERRRARDGSM